jgi:hypothetical protein
MFASRAESAADLNSKQQSREMAVHYRRLLAEHLDPGGVQRASSLRRPHLSIARPNSKPPSSIILPPLLRHFDDRGGSFVSLFQTARRSPLSMAASSGCRGVLLMHAFPQAIGCLPRRSVNSRRSFSLRKNSARSTGNARPRLR